MRNVQASEIEQIGGGFWGFSGEPAPILFAEDPPPLPFWVVGPSAADSLYPPPAPTYIHVPTEDWPTDPYTFPIDM